MKAEEDKIQIAVANYMRLQYPKVLSTHFPSGGQRNVIVGAKLKRMGLKRGLPDYLIFERKFYIDTFSITGLALEFKYGKNKQTPEQKEVQKQLEENGWDYHVCYDFDTAKKIIDNYLNN